MRDRTQLTEREQQIFALSVQGLTRAQIAARLGISEDTVRTYRTSISQRLHLPKGTKLASIAQKGESNGN
jgi:DNA-binding NarL/FixJ family response regulator